MPVVINGVIVSRPIIVVALTLVDGCQEVAWSLDSLRHLSYMVLIPVCV